MGNYKPVWCLQEGGEAGAWRHLSTEPRCFARSRAISGRVLATICRDTAISGVGDHLSRHRDPGHLKGDVAPTAKQGDRLF
jgi:hypothetical protein